jgi:hypothetical protein
LLNREARNIYADWDRDDRAAHRAGTETRYRWSCSSSLSASFQPAAAHFREDSTRRWKGSELRIRQQLSRTPIWVRLPAIIGLVLVGVLIATAFLGTWGSDRGHGGGGMGGQMPTMPRRDHSGGNHGAEHGSGPRPTKTTTGHAGSSHG